MKRKFSILIAVILAVSVISSSSVIFGVSTEYDFDYQEISDGIKITGYTGTDADVAIPDTIDGKPVTVLGANLFYNNQTLTSVSIPDTVHTFENGVFQACKNLREVTLPDSLKTMGIACFLQCTSLHRVNFNDKLEVIGDGCFLETDLEAVTLPDSVTLIKGNAFLVCPNLSFIKIPHNAVVQPSFTGCDDDLIIVGCKNSSAHQKAIEKGITFAEVPCTNHTFENGVCTCCSAQLGDVNNDGVISPLDALTMTQYLADPETPIDFSLADIDESGKVNERDNVLLKKILVATDIFSDNNHTFSHGTCTICDLKKGDLNCDGLVNNTDLTLMSQYISGDVTSSSSYTEAARNDNIIYSRTADIDGFGEINNRSKTLLTYLLSGSDIFNHNNNHTFSHGICPVCGLTFGDVNCDGLVDYTDLTILYSYQSGNSSIRITTAYGEAVLTSNIYFYTADVDMDGEVTDSDIGAIHNYVDSTVPEWP